MANRLANQHQTCDATGSADSKCEYATVLTTVRCEIFPADLDTTANFYTRVLGFGITQDSRDRSEPYIALRRDQVMLGALKATAPAVSEARQPPVGVELVLEVDDLQAERDRVGAEGWPVAEEISERPWGLRDFRVLDPDGYYWRITTRR